MQRFKTKEAKELKETGTGPTKIELDGAIEQIIAMEESADEQPIWKTAKRRKRWRETG